MCEIKQGHDYGEDAKEEMGLKPRNQGLWKTIATSLFGVLMLLIGAFAGDFAASVRYTSLHSRMTDHERLEGHPVMTERVRQFQDQLDRIEKQGLNNATMLATIAAKQNSDGS